MKEKIPLPNESQSHDSHYAEFEGKSIDVYKLIRLAEDVEAIKTPTKNFEDHLSNHYWHDSHGDWLGPQDIIDVCDGVANPQALTEDESYDSGLREHLKRVLDSDYTEYPIITIKGVVVDGMHRLTKAVIDGVDSIAVKDFAELPDCEPR
jgi:hypothetical protein